MSESSRRRSCPAIQEKPDWPNWPTDRFRLLTRIRAFEETLLEAFRAGRIAGTTHTCIGQEATPVAVSRFLTADDVIFSNHRCHGHFIASGGDAQALLLEIIGSSDGICAGHGGSQHIHDGRFHSTGIQGGSVPVAAGAAFAERLRGTGAIGVCFIGDGTLGEGLVYEATNLASLLDIPLLLVVENNGIAQTTPLAAHLAGSIRQRFEAFGLEVGEVTADDLDALDDAFATAFQHVRERRRPYCQIVHTVRLGPHSKGDDYRPPELLAAQRRSDPLRLAALALPAAEAERIRAEEAVATAALFQGTASAPQAGSAVALPGDEEAINGPGPPDWRPVTGLSGAGSRINEAIGQVLRRRMADDARLHLLGEDILDPYGGAFAVYRGLSTAFPERVHGTPISEAAIVGLANGMALRGLKPIVEIMFGDFLCLAMDQLLNHAAKFPVMYGPRAPGCPVIVRTPMGGYRGYGPTHSQSLEKFFVGVPGLVTTALSPLHDIAALWDGMLGIDRPILHVENKTLYGGFVPVVAQGRIDGFVVRGSARRFPTLRLRLREAARPPRVALVTYGGLTGMALAAARELFVEDELDVEVVVPSLLSPLPMRDIAAAVAGAELVMVLEEGTGAFGWGAEVVARLASADAAGRARFRRLAAVDTAIPNAPALERTVLPSQEKITDMIREAVR